MKKIVLLFCFYIFCLGFVIPLEAIQSPNVDQVEEMLKKIERNLQSASEVTSIAKAKAEKLVNSKIKEKADLKSEVKKAKSDISELKKQNSLFANKILTAGLDTSLTQDEFKYSGPIWDEYQLYLKNGGTSDFEYYRLYRK
jgi:hypothetical protein